MQSSGSRGGVSGRLGQRPGSVESTATQVLGDDDIRHRIKDELDVVGIRGTGDMAVDLLVSRLVLTLILPLDVSHSFCEGTGACKMKQQGSVSGGTQALDWPLCHCVSGQRPWSRCQKPPQDH